jgi:hypothetical protein
MKSTPTTQKSLEGLRFFPAIAWSVFILFSVFVFLLASELRTTTTAIETMNSHNAEILGEPVQP